MKQEQIIKVPDIGGASDVDVIDILVAPGQTIEIDTPLVTLESDKASMDIPSPIAGEVVSLAVKVGDKVSEGSPLVTVLAISSSALPVKEALPTTAVVPVQAETRVTPAPKFDQASTMLHRADPYAGPAVRRLARELGVALTVIKGTGRKSRILREDVIAFFKSSCGFTAAVSPQVAIDFSQFGEIEMKPLNKIKRLTAKQVHRAWNTIPHVTQFDEADITDLEAFRLKEMEKVQSQHGAKLTVLAFIVKALTQALSQFPQFNASLDASGESLIYKHYFNIGIAVETQQGLVVPVVKNADRLSIGEIAKEMKRLSALAREKGVSLADLQGGSFTISSLGGVGGTAFTPIVNAPEVAILGVSRARMKLIYQESEFVPRLMLPLSLSYDHRVIDGAEGARFLGHVTTLLNDVGRILL